MHTLKMTLLVVPLFALGCSSAPAPVDTLATDGATQQGADAAPTARDTGDAQGVAGDAPGVTGDAWDHPAPECDQARSHLRGTLRGVDVAAHLCDFQYALLENVPWTNWTAFSGGLLLLGGSEDIFKATAPTLSAGLALLRMPTITARADEVYCGSGSYYEAPDDSPPDAELTIDISGYAGRCGGSGEGTLTLTSTAGGNDSAEFAIGGETLRRPVKGSYHDGERFAFFLETGFISIEVVTPLPDTGAGESAIASMTITLRDGDKRLLLGCGESIGTVKQVPSTKGLDFEVRVSGLAPWIDCSRTEAATGRLTLTHDPAP